VVTAGSEPEVELQSRDDTSNDSSNSCEQDGNRR